MRSIIFRLTAYFLVFICCVFGVIYLLATGIQRQSLEKTRNLADRMGAEYLRGQWEKQAKAMVDLYAEQLVRPLYVMDIQTIQDMTAVVGRQGSMASIHVLDDKGRVLSDGAKDPAQTGLVYSPDMRLGPDTFLVKSPIVAGPRVLGSVVAEFDIKAILQAGDDLNAKARKIFDLAAADNARQLGTLFVFAALVGVLGATLLTRGLTWRIDKISDSIEQLARHDYDIVLSGDSRDEIGRLGTTLRHVAASLRDSTVTKSYLEALINNMPVGMAVTDQAGRILVSNPCFRDLCGPSGGPPAPLAEALPLDPPGLDPLLDELRRKETMVSRDITLSCPERIVDAHLLGVPIAANGKPADTHFLFVIHDISERKNFERRLADLANHDHLTGLANRRSIITAMEEELRLYREDQEKGFWLAFVDLDEFKTINDTLGHAAGDVILSAVAIRLAEASRVSDVVARLGGDEFLVLLRGDIPPAKAKEIGQRFLEYARGPFFVNGAQVSVSASIGLARSDRRHASADDILREADAAMYEAKKLGRDRLVILPYELASQDIKGNVSHPEPKW